MHTYTQLYTYIFNNMGDMFKNKRTPQKVSPWKIFRRDLGRDNGRGESN